MDPKVSCSSCKHLFNGQHCLETGCISSILSHGYEPAAPQVSLWSSLQKQAMNGRDTTMATDSSAGRFDHATGTLTPWPDVVVVEDAQPLPGGALSVQVGGSHYKDMKIQPIEFVIANGLPFVEGSVVKYVSRWRKKGGVADLKKARHLLDVLIENEEKEAA